MSGGALEGIKVIELATMVSGPYCGKMLADLGADVIKIEPPEGDPSRQVGPFPNTGVNPECSALFLYNNTSKRGITLNLNITEGMTTLKRLIGWADVLIDNHPPQYLDNLGLTWDVIHEINPGLVYTCITAYGRTGPRAGVKGDELTLVHAGSLGNLFPTRSYDIDRAPVKMGGYAVGYHGGLHAALITLGALMGKRKTGYGQMIDISLQEVILSMNRTSPPSSRYLGATWSRVPDRPPGLGRMKTSDGYVVVGAVEDHHFKAFVELMGNPEWASSPRWLNMAYRTNHSMEIAPLLDEWMSHQKKDDIHHRAAKMGVPIGPVNSVRDVMEDGQYLHRNYFVEAEHPVAGKYKYPGWPYKMPASPPRISKTAPLLGQHNREVYCTVLAYSPAEYEHLQQVGVILTKGGKDDR